MIQQQTTFSTAISLQIYYALYTYDMDGLVDGAEPGAFHVLKALPDEAFASLPFVAVGKAVASFVCPVPDCGLGGMLEVVDRVSSVNGVVVFHHRHQRRPVDPVDGVQAAA